MGSMVVHDVTIIRLLRGLTEQSDWLAKQAQSAESPLQILTVCRSTAMHVRVTAAAAAAVAGRATVAAVATAAV